MTTMLRDRFAVLLSRHGLWHVIDTDADPLAYDPPHPDRAYAVSIYETPSQDIAYEVCIGRNRDTTGHAACSRIRRCPGCQGEGAYDNGYWSRGYFIDRRTTCSRCGGTGAMAEPMTIPEHATLP